MLTKIDNTSDNGADQSKSHNIYVSMARMSPNAESLRRYFRDILQLSNWILDSGVTCNVIPYIYDFMPVSLVEMYKYTKFADENFITTKQTGEAQIKMHEDNDKLFIDKVCNILFALVVRSIIFHYYVNEFGTYLYFS